MEMSFYVYKSVKYLKQLLYDSIMETLFQSSNSQYIYCTKTSALHYLVLPQQNNINKYMPKLTEMFQMFQEVFNPIITFKHCLLNVMSAKYTAVFRVSCAVTPRVHESHKTEFFVIY
jgi:hypothetical protein